ncbi:hypothetical protein QYF36_015199 [Acer negundo]|nr:hypothetical protein QYF36_015199 [Acer negundo]
MSAGSLFFIAEIAQVMTKTRRFDSPNSSNRVNSGWPHQSKRQFSGYFPISKTESCGNPLSKGSSTPTLLPDLGATELPDLGAIGRAGRATGRIEEGMELRKERHSSLRGLQKYYPYPHETTIASSMEPEVVEEGAAREAA